MIQSWPQRRRISSNKNRWISSASSWRKPLGPQNLRIRTTKMALWCYWPISMSRSRRLSQRSFKKKNFTLHNTRLWLGTQAWETFTKRWGRICIGHIRLTMFSPLLRPVSHAPQREETCTNIRSTFTCFRIIEHCNWTLSQWTSWGHFQKQIQETNSF